MIAYRRKIQILVTVNLALAVAIGLGLFFSPGWSGKRPLHRIILADIEAVARISIQGPETLELTGSGSNWVVVEPGTSLPAEASLPSEASLPADAGRIRAFLSVLGGLDRLETVATGSSSWADLGLAEGSAKRVVLYDRQGAVLASLAVGKYDPTGGRSYLRLDPAETVYAGPASLASYLSGGQRPWLDLRIWDRQYAPEDVQSLLLRGGLELSDGSTVAVDYRLTRSGPTWVADQPGMQLDTQKVDRMVRSILAARGEGYLQPGDSGLPALIINVGLGDGSALELAIGADGTDERFAARSSRRSRPMALSSWTIREAIKPLGELLVSAP
jgi:hypothetical protein